MDNTSESVRVKKQFSETHTDQAIVWAARAATRRALDDHSPEAGYTSMTFGHSFRALFTDKLHRVFSTRSYSLPEGVDPESGRDVVNAELTPDEIQTMPNIQAGLFKFSETKGSPSWSYNNVYIFLQSAGVNSFDQMRWDHSKVKKNLAAIPYHTHLIETPLQTQFELFADHSSSFILPTNGIPLILAYKVNALSGLSGLAIGRPKDNQLDTGSWHWYSQIDYGMALDRHPRFKTEAIIRDQTEDTKIALRKKIPRTTSEQP